ncbi:SagB family peptide dehydrogenase [Paenibacillus ginsengarvi]|uniref:SagB/ThcOx family dehydrogenase n=1 Tax=Paenibacillus ginsengarvi TaxID=400777 RepID=A0A3B0CGP6_9BACL|nr:SagB family peptide dehydrogenase [Paenibacillus ginsengarvi]RKN84018.1 SagB/ThcOx family dehydrogenase [Paenibacillus ginsengarvi]
MSLDDFVRELHGDPRKSPQPEAPVDWDDAPLKYKLYRGLPAIPLCPEVPLALPGRSAAPEPGLKALGHMLWYTYGLTMWSQTYRADPIRQSAELMQTPRRYVPSGGGLYPNEIYVYVRTADAPAGVYHYDAAHHRLLLIRAGEFDEYVSGVLGGRCRIPDCFAVLFVSAVFWRNFFKYGDFSYRLQGLDTGALIGQTLESAARFGFSAGVYYQYLDRAVNHLLGLSEREESVYAIIPLSVKSPDTWFAAGGDRTADGGEGSRELCRELETVRHRFYERSKRIKPYPLLLRMNEASMQESAESFRESAPTLHADSGLRASYLPCAEAAEQDFAAICRARYSPETEFSLRPVTGEQVSALLRGAAFSCRYRSDLGGASEHPLSRVSLHVCLYSVEGIPDGAYRYEPVSHALRSLLPGDHRSRLQYGMFLHNINLFQVPLCFHVTGRADFGKPEWGYRGYRIQQMEAGVVVQRLLLAASAVGMAGRPLLGFDAGVCDVMYAIRPQGGTSLIQIPVGSCHPVTRLQGALHG